MFFFRARAEKGIALHIDASSVVWTLKDFCCSKSQCYVIKQMVNAIACTIELWMHLGGLLSTQEARVALGYRLVRLLRFFRA